MSSRCEAFPAKNGILFYTPYSLEGWDGLLFYIGVTLFKSKRPKYVHTALYYDGYVINLVDDGLRFFEAKWYDPKFITFVPDELSNPWYMVETFLADDVRIHWLDFIRAMLGRPLRGMVCTSFVKLFLAHSLPATHVHTADELYDVLDRSEGFTEGAMP